MTDIKSALQVEQNVQNASICIIDAEEKFKIMLLTQNNELSQYTLIQCLLIGCHYIHSVRLHDS
jgi:hypothetical protein